MTAPLHQTLVSVNLQFSCLMCKEVFRIDYWMHSQFIFWIQRQFMDSKCHLGRSLCVSGRVKSLPIQHDLFYLGVCSTACFYWFIAVGEQLSSISEAWRYSLFPHCVLWTSWHVSLINALLTNDSSAMLLQRYWNLLFFVNANIFHLKSKLSVFVFFICDNQCSLGLIFLSM